MDDFALLKTAASGMDAQRAALDVSARNIAAAEAAGPRGRFPREVAQFRLIESGGVSEVAFAGSKTERGSDVDTIAEMVSVLNASRAFEANSSVFEIGKQLALRTIDMGRV
ncbi:MAG TPA: flagellar basal body rod C-terminal domain-containing protein [Candidatus Baltobacteraceae bacterium]|nr:flagellar basal body rod C-terminal domain-containing protein [Candidatus Baltobacteraceae bacterium]